jgi:signal transduction histidine kinase
MCWCAITDVTDRRRIEQELVRAKEIAEEHARAKSSFLSSMSHELRTPLMAIIANCNVVEEIAAGNPDIESYTKVIEANSKRLIEIINDILDLSRLEGRRNDFAGEVIDPVETVQNIVKMLEPISKKKSVSLSLGTQATELRIFANPSYLERILTNLIGNAIKFTNSGTILVHVIEDGQKTDPRVSICVVDTGIGISESFLPFIFDEFRRERKSFDSDGSGLGLTITKKLVESMNGSIEIRSSEGKGTTVMVRFPKV